MSNYTKKFSVALFVAFTFVLPSIVVAQTIAVDEVTAVSTGTSVSVGWSLDDGNVLEGVAFTIQYDDAVFTPNLTNCFVVEDADSTSCAVETVGGQDFVKIGLLNFSTGDQLGAASGTIVFNYASGAGLGDYDLTVAEDSPNTIPAATSITLDNGKITMQAAPAPAISVSPTPATITAENGSTDTQTFTVTNSGNDSGLTVSAATISGTNSANFDVTGNNCPTSGGLAVAATCSIVVEFAPNAVTSFTASLAIVSSAGTENIALSGTGTAGPAGDITITPASTFDFGELLTGVDSATQVFTATNTGAAGSTVTIGSAGLNTLFGSPFSITTANTCTNGTELDKDESCAVTVKFEPTSDGEATRTLTVSGTDANSTSVTDSSAMEGTGVTKSIYTSDPAAGDSDSEVVGPEGSNDFTITLGNDGNADYTYSAALTSTSASVFSVTAGASGTVAGGESATVTVNCTLEDTETYEGSVVITVGDDEYTYNYECVGLPPLPVPVDNKWALALLALMMLMAASFGFRFMARQ